MPQRRSDRIPALAGIVGPVFFVAMWAILGTVRSGYSPIHDAISRLAEFGTSTRPAMTVGFIGYGLALCLYALDTHLPKPARVLVAGTGVATLGVAAFALGHSSTIDAVHTVIAAVGYVTLAATPLVTARTLAQRGHATAARLSAAIGIVSGVFLALSAFDPAHGLTQRIGLTVGDAWIVAASWHTLTAARRPRLR